MAGIGLDVSMGKSGWHLIHRPQVAGAGYKTSPLTRPAKTAVAVDPAQLQNLCGLIVDSHPKPVDKRAKPARPANNPQLLLLSSSLT